MIDDRERVVRMLPLAHPEWRAFLSREARVLPAIQGIDAVAPQLVSLNDNYRAIVRPATQADINKVKAYIKELSPADRATRFFGHGTTLEALTSKKRLQESYDQTLDFQQHCAIVMERDSDIIGVAHAFLTDESEYEISFSRRSDMAGQGIGDHLMRMLVEWARQRDVSVLHAVTYATQNPGMCGLFERSNFKCSPDPDDMRNVIYRARVSDISVAA